MATDSIISDAGRTGGTLILNGSRSKKGHEWEWDQLPDYGRLQHLTVLHLPGSEKKLPGRQKLYTY